MSESPVFGITMRAKPGKGPLRRYELLLREAGFDALELRHQFTAIKLHVGEEGNLAFLRPEFAAKTAEMVRLAGGCPFVTDANTLYSGKRGNAIDHLETAARHGYNRLSLGCDFIVSDGIRGTDYREVFIDKPNFDYAKIAAVIADTDVIITLSHFKGHELTGIGGTIKNLGMGCAAVPGKLEMHSSSKPKTNDRKCTACGMCVRYCPESAITLELREGTGTAEAGATGGGTTAGVSNESGGLVRKAEINYSKCIGCGQCIAMCQYGAVSADLNEPTWVVGEKIAEYAYAAVLDKPCLHVNFVTNVSPNCDCWSYNDAPLIADLGIFASTDPVALDAACADAVNAAAPLPGTVLDDKGLKGGDDKFAAVHPKTDWRRGLAHAEEIGLGSTKYSLEMLE